MAGPPHDSRGNVVIIAGAVTNSLAALAVSARIYTQLMIRRSVGVDDGLAVLSLVRRQKYGYGVFG